MTDPIANTTAGPVRGVAADGVLRFLAVPYAAAPVGELRFAAPAPPVPWTAPRDATSPGPTAPQLGRPFPALDLAPVVGEGWRKGDDYLNACVWTPDLAARGLPVMVFIHGGAFLGGCADASAYDGAAFARSGVVLISISYRVGIEGFVPVPGAPTNLGLRDQIAALHWVRDNAAAFGGDPANVTVFGESAGAMSVADLIGSPLTEGLFRRAIVQSGHGSMVHPLSASLPMIERLAVMLGVAPTRDGFAAAPLEACVEAVANLAAAGFSTPDAEGRDPGHGLSPFRPVWGDDVLPLLPLDAAATGAGKQVDLLIGANLDELNLYFVPTGVRQGADAAMATAMLQASEPAAGAILADYGLGDASTTPGDALTRAMTDLVFRLPARRFAAAHPGRSHVYEYGWRSPALEGQLGACHGLELPFVFDTLASAVGPSGLLGPTAPPKDLADRIHRVWVDFARDGTLPWPEYDLETRQIYRLETGHADREDAIAAERHTSP